MVKVFCGKMFDKLGDEIKEFEEENPNLEVVSVGGLTEDKDGWLTLAVAYKEKNKKEEPTTNQLLEGLIGAVNELTDTVGLLTEKK